MDRMDRTAMVYICWTCGEDLEVTEQDGLADSLEVSCPDCGSDLVAVVLGEAQMNQIVQQLYEHGDTEQLVATAQGTGIVTDDCSGAREALRLLARLGDQDAAAFCGSAPETYLSATRAY